MSGEIEIHSTDRGEPTAEEEMLLAAMTERLARFFERKSLQSALERSEQRYRMVFDSTPVAMISCDARGIVFDVNAYLLSKFFQDEIGKQELVGRHVLELGLCDLTGRETDFMQFARGLCVNLREAPILESRYRGAGYANIRCLPLMDAHGKVEGGLVIIEDITEVREAQRAMIQSAKMAAVGQMMTGFAHEAGTPLGTISANAQYLLKGWEGKAGADELHAILSETNRIANLIEKLLIFARPARFHLLPTSLNDMIQEVLSMMQNQEIMRGIEVITDFRPDIPPLPVEPTLAKQVFFNLIINAAQAMPIGGRLTIASRLSRSRPGSRQPGPYVEVALTDTGVGISPSNLRKIFTPFFTTKEFGKGVGLGLSLSYRIVQNHGGTIVAESRGEGRGATFRVYLPLAGPSRDMSETSGDWIEPVARKRGDHNGSR
ncbi:PAS domain S-box protein [Candidatus Sumerlaeota bacterium]|nr:PAS domain S-box protein [Candidatus Sumerlaeota bacterium]